MQFARTTSAGALFLLFGAMVPAYAQHEEQKEARPAPQQQHAQQQAPQQRPQQQQRAQQAPQQRPKQQQQQQRAQQTQQQRPQQQRAQQAQQQKQQQQPAQRAPQAQQAQQQQQPQRSRQQASAWQQQRGWQHGGGWQGHTTFQQGRDANWQSDHRTWAQRGGYGGYYIPDATFSLSFGNQHWFRMHSRPSMYMGYPRFSDGGYSFMLVDPWPEDWAADWYDTDDLYIGFDNGYYLYDRNYPGVGLAITVAL